MYYLESASTEDITEYFKINDLKLSNYDPSTGIVTIYHPYIWDFYKLDFSEWLEEDRSNFIGYIKFPGFPENNGVESLETEDSQESPVYFNLQGIRVDQPENGIYLQIEKGKARKVIK